MKQLSESECLALKIVAIVHVDTPLTVERYN